MMGLLDFDSDKQRKALALLAAAGPSATPQSFGQRLFAGMSAYQQDKTEREAAEQRRKQMEAQQQFQQFQMQQALAAMAKAKQQEEAEAALRQQQEGFLGRGMRSPVTGGQAVTQAGPTPAAAQMMNQPAPFDMMTAIRLFGVDTAKKLAESQDWGKAEVTRTIKGMSSGREVEQQFDKFGRPVGSGIEQYRAPLTVNQGDRTTFLDPFKLSQLAQFGINQSPDSRASNAVQMRGQNMTDARARERLALDQGIFAADAGGPGQMALVKQFGKPPKDHRWKPDGSAEPIPGGPADIKAGEAGAKAAARAEAGKSQANDVLETVQEAKRLVGYGTAGIGGITASIPATPGRDLQAKLTTIKANLGFDRLQQMRDMSPTGGALGQVAVQELVSLQSTVASLDQLQSPGDLRKALDKIERHYKRWQETLGGASGGASGDWGSKPAQRSIDDLLKKYGN